MGTESEDDSSPSAFASVSHVGFFRGVHFVAFGDRWRPAGIAGAPHLAVVAVAGLRCLAWTDDVGVPPPTASTA